jgi:glutamine synthetase
VSKDERGASSAEELRRFVEEHGITTFKIGAVDLDGLWRGKRIATPYFLEGVSVKGTNICNILFGWDMQDQLIEGLGYTGWQTGYPDITLMPDLSTLTVVPWEPGTASVICDIKQLDGSPLMLSPRALLKRLVDQAAAAGYEPMCGYEFEFYLLRGTPDEVAAAEYRNLVPFTRGSHTYSVYRDTASEYLIGEIRRQLADYGIYIEASNSEHGPGQFEVNMRFCHALDAADHAMLLKHSVKELAARHGCTASFIAKLSPQWAGSSGHMHQSLRSGDGTPAFANPEDPTRLSSVGESYLAGILDLAKDFTALYLPTVNSYKRTEGGSWAGSSATWGMDNRTVAVRAIPGSGGSARIENRIAGADANPYLVIAANLAAGLHGLSKGLVPPAAIAGNAYEQADRSTALPNTLESAVNTLDASTTARTLLGDSFVDHFVATRRWELKQFREAVTDWEIARYLEHI